MSQEFATKLGALITNTQQAEHVSLADLSTKAESSTHSDDLFIPKTEDQATGLEASKTLPTSTDKIFSSSSGVLSKAAGNFKRLLSQSRSGERQRTGSAARLRTLPNSIRALPNTIESVLPIITTEDASLSVPDRAGQELISTMPRAISDTVTQNLDMSSSVDGLAKLSKHGSLKADISSIFGPQETDNCQQSTELVTQPPEENIKEHF